jgi:hypothetical protein
MAEDNIREVYKALGDAQNRYTYFLLAAAGAAIAFAVNQTHSALMNWWQAPLAVAVLFWGMSFFLGCRHVAYGNSAKYENLELLIVHSGQHPEVGTHPQKMAIAIGVITEAMKKDSAAANKCGQGQFRYLVAGPIFYILWHVIEMYLRSFA